MPSMRIGTMLRSDAAPTMPHMESAPTRPAIHANGRVARHHLVVFAASAGALFVAALPGAGAGHCCAGAAFFAVPVLVAVPFGAGAGAGAGADIGAADAVRGGASLACSVLMHCF